MSYTFLAILLIVSIGIPAYGFHPPSAQTAIEVNSIQPVKDTHYCDDRTVSRMWEFRKKGTIVRLKAFRLSSSID